jgi:phage gpG-like protein
VITVELVGGKQLVAKLAAMPERVREALERAVKDLAFELQREVQQAKLSGQVLKVRTGGLRSSINTVFQHSAETIEASVGTNIRYGRVHEYGFDGTVEVPAHIRRISEAFGRPIAPTVASVRAHSRHLHLPERSFLRSALAEMAPLIEERLRLAVAEAL